MKFILGRAKWGISRLLKHDGEPAAPLGHEVVRERLRAQRDGGRHAERGGADFTVEEENNAIFCPSREITFR